MNEENLPVIVYTRYMN